MKNKEIAIKETSINGILNPLFTLKFETKIKEFEIKVLIDGEKYDDFEFFNNGDNITYIVRIKYPQKAKKIKVVMLIDGNQSTIYKTRNNLFARILNKIKGILRKIYMKIKVVLHVLAKGIRFMWKEYHFLVPPKLIGKYWKDLKISISRGDLRFYDPMDSLEYNKWLSKNQTVSEYQKMKYEPLISILIPVYNIGKKYLSECIESILNQNYKNFEICLVDDCSTKEETKETLKEYEEKDKRIKVIYRKENGHISRATNDALKMAKGEFIALMDDDDLLTPDALFENVKVLNNNKKLDLIYSDEDKLSPSGVYCYPNFKPDFSPDTLLSLNYICHFVVIRKRIVEEVNGFTVGLEGAQDYDLLLKVTEKTNNIYHIPKILYHWRMVEGSTSMTISNKSYAVDKGKAALENALKRRNIKAHVEKDEVSTYYRIVYDYKEEPLISIIIPTRDYMQITKKCVDSIYEKTTYKNYEIIIANNDSKEKETLDFFDEYSKKHKNFRVIDCKMEFNYSKINNIAVEKSKGEYIVLLNNDTEVITPEWLTLMVGYAMQDHIGCVGAKLLYPEDLTVQHAGVIIGLGGVASHAYIGQERNATGIYGRLRVPYNYSANTAACLMISKKKYEEVNGLNEKLKVAYNDVDFNLKLLEKGYYNVTLPHVELIHYESKSRGLDTTSEKYQRFLEESRYMHEKWGKYIKNDPFYSPNFAKKMWFKLDR